MTIRLLTPYDKYPINAIVTLDASTEAGLVAAKMAQIDTTGGVPYIAPVAPNQRYGAQVEVDSSGTVIGLAHPNGGRFLIIGGVAPNNSDGRADGTVYIQNGIGTGVAGYFTKIAGAYKALGGGGAQAIITGNYAVGQTLTAAYPVGTVGTIQFTRTLIATPFTKTLISGAVASAVNSLAYTLQSADVGCNIGVDCSNQVSSAAGGAVAATAVNVYARMQSALAAVSAGTGYAKVGLLGDSTMAGYAGSGSTTPVRASTPVVFLRDQLIATQGRPVIASSWTGDQRFQVTNSVSPYTFDTRFSQPDGVGFIASTGATPVTVAGSLLNNSTNANRFGFLPEVATDTTDVYYAVNTTLGAFSITRNGGGTVPVNQAGASGMGKTTYSSPVNSVDPIYISRTSGGAYLIGMDSYNSAIKTIRLFGLGWAGGRAADFAATATGFDPLNALVALGLDLVVPRFGTNDISIPGASTTSTDPTAYQASINKILDALAAAGTNVILATHYPMNTTVTSQAVQDTYAGYVRSIATARGLKVHDTYARVGTWAASNAAGKMYDNLHPNAAGYQDDAVALAALILTLA